MKYLKHITDSGGRIMFDYTCVYCMNGKVHPLPPEQQPLGNVNVAFSKKKLSD